MKFIKWKSLIITSLVCLLPILLGIALWNELPDMVAIHFNFYNEPDNYASKAFAVFVLPVMMVILQMFCCFINDINAHKHGVRKKFEMATKWIIPIMSIILQSIIFFYAIGWNIDIRKATVLMVGAVFLVTGNYLPKFDYVKNYNLDAEKARKINRFIGFETVIMGILILLTIFLPPVTTVVWLILLIPYTIVSIIYSIKVARSK